jgi:cell volume regulation protein A
MNDAEIVLAVGGLLIAGLAAASIADRLGLPALLLFLGIGMAVGSDGAGWVRFDDYLTAQRIGTGCLAVILFEGGLRADFSEVRSVLGVGIRLAFLGTVLTAFITGLTITLLFHLPILEALLLGSILASTDSAAVFGLLRRSSLHRRLSGTLEVEAGLNDPVAILLVLGFVSWIASPDYGAVDIMALFGRQLLVGGIAGLLAGLVGGMVFNYRWLPAPGLYLVASLAIGAVAFGAAASLQGSGFLAVYLAGLTLGNRARLARRSTALFQSGLASLAQILLFLTLGLLVSPSHLGSGAREGLGIALVLAFVARPLAVWTVTVFDRFSVAEKTLLAWTGLRGAVPVVLATIPVIQHSPHSGAYFNIVFFVVLASALMQGATIASLSETLGLTVSSPPLPRPLAELGTIRGLGAEVVEYPVSATSAIAGRQVAELMLPEQASVTVIVRGEDALPPQPWTQIRAGDVLHLLVRSEAATAMEQRLLEWDVTAEQPSVAVTPLQVATALPMGYSGSSLDPEIIGGVPVIDALHHRRDAPGALLLLENGSYAVTGDSLISGHVNLIRQYARQRFTSAPARHEQVWWREVLVTLGALDQREAGDPSIVPP